MHFMRDDGETGDLLALQERVRGCQRAIEVQVFVEGEAMWHRPGCCAVVRYRDRRNNRSLALSAVIE
jgi:hypothetical protein